MSFLKPSASIFRLKREYKNLRSEEDANNLISYFDNSRSSSTITMADLQSVLSAMHSQTETSSNLISNDPETATTESVHQVGDFVAAIWIEGNEYHWYLANIVEVVNEDALLLTYFKKVGNSKDGEIWFCPENPELLITDTYQIIHNRLDVLYVRSARIKCCVSNETVKLLNDSLNEKLKNTV